MPEEIRPAPVAPSLMAKINEQLEGITDRSVAAIVQVPQDGRLRGGVFVNVGHGFSFAGWLEKDLDAKKGMGYGVALRKKW